MPLPKINSAIFEVTLPGTKEPVRYRPCTMNEYKTLLQAKEFGDDMRICCSC